jgi:hypothetical protein
VHTRHALHQVPDFCKAEALGEIADVAYERRLYAAYTCVKA